MLLGRARVMDGEELRLQQILLYIGQIHRVRLQLSSDHMYLAGVRVRVAMGELNPSLKLCIFLKVNTFTLLANDFIAK